MGWTSKSYNEAEHLTVSADQIKTLIKDEITTYPYELIKFHLDKARDIDSHNVAYLVVKHPKGDAFIMVVLIDIVKNEIFWKEVTASMGPVEDRCPVSFLRLAKVSSGYEKDWRDKVIKNNITL